MISGWARAFVDLVATRVAESRSPESFPFTIVETHVIADEAIFLGRTFRGDVATGVVVRTDRFAELFSGSLDAAVGAFVVELMEPGWDKGDTPSSVAKTWAETRSPAIWWMAMTPPPSAVLE